MAPLLYCVLPALGSYVVLSLFFLRRPRLLHTPWAPAFPVRLAAHRGGEPSRGGFEVLVATWGGVSPVKQVGNTEKAQVADAGQRPR